MGRCFCLNKSKSSIMAELFCNTGMHWRNIARLADCKYDELAANELQRLIEEVRDSNLKDSEIYIDILKGYVPSDWNKSAKKIIEIVNGLPKKIQVIKKLIKKIYINQHIPAKQINMEKLVNILIDAIGKRMPKACNTCDVWYIILNPQHLIRKCCACLVPTHPTCA